MRFVNLHLNTQELTWLKWLVADSMLHHPGSQLGVAKGNVWSGPKDFKFTDEVDHLPQHIEAHAGAKIREVWANIIVGGGSIDPHDHNDGINTLTAVLYLTPSMISLKELIEVTSSQSKYREFAVGDWKDYCFQPGDCVFFSPNIEHQVKPHISQHPRISIALNLI